MEEEEVKAIGRGENELFIRHRTLKIRDGFCFNQRHLLNFINNLEEFTIYVDLNVFSNLILFQRKWINAQRN
jgi:hypothetical protein